MPVFRKSGWLQVETGMPATLQEGSNGTVQDTQEGLTFTVAVHVAVPAGAASSDENVLRHYLVDVMQAAIDGTGGSTLAVEIQTGPSDYS